MIRRAGFREVRGYEQEEWRSKMRSGFGNVNEDDQQDCRYVPNDRCRWERTENSGKGIEREMIRVSA